MGLCDLSQPPQLGRIIAALNREVIVNELRGGDAGNMRQPF